MRHLKIFLQHILHLERQFLMPIRKLWSKTNISNKIPISFQNITKNKKSLSQTLITFQK